MKALIVSRDEAATAIINHHLQPLGLEVDHYPDPLKATQDIETLDPEIIIFHAGDFPRHWKPFLKLLRERRSKEEAVFILLTDPSYPFEEAAKASHLGINGLVKADLANRQELYRLEELIRRYRFIKDHRKFHRLVPGKVDRLALIFSHPRTLAIVTGTLTDISIRGAGFVAHNPALIADLGPDGELPLCSLRLGEEVISVLCRITRNQPTLGLEFKSFETGGHHKLFQYLQGRSERELKAAIASGRE